MLASDGFPPDSTSCARRWSQPAAMPQGVKQSQKGHSNHLYSPKSPQASQGTPVYPKAPQLTPANPKAPQSVPRCRPRQPQGTPRLFSHLYMTQGQTPGSEMPLCYERVFLSHYCTYADVLLQKVLLDSSGCSVQQIWPCLPGMDMSSCCTCCLMLSNCTRACCMHSQSVVLSWPAKLKKDSKVTWVQQLL